MSSVRKQLINPAEVLSEKWGIRADRIIPVAVRENRVYKVVYGEKSYALKISRPSYRSKESLESEVNLLNYLSEEGFPVADFIPAPSGESPVETADGFASLQVWLDGKPLGKSGEPIEHPDCPGIFFEVGKSLARLHKLGRAWKKPGNFSRPDWGREGLAGDNPVWGRFWENPRLTEKEREELIAFRDYARSRLPEDEGHIIHADTVKENIFLTLRGPVFIDYDDFGTGYELFDLATTLLKNDTEPNFEQLRTELFRGYSEILPLDLSLFDLLTALRAVTYIGWIIPRQELDPNGERSKRYFKHAVKYIRKL